MRAAVTRGVGEGFAIMQIELADPVGREVLVEVKAAGLCRTDHSNMANDFGIPMPAVFGHELAGVVAAVGPNVSGLSVGDHVTGCLVKWCGTCSPCVAGRPVDCRKPSAVERRDSDPPRLSLDGRPVYQGSGIGAFAERALVHENQLARVPEDIPFSRAALLGCSTITGAGAVVNSARVPPGAAVAVLGTGGVGLNAIAAAQLVGAKTIIAVDSHLSKLAMAKRFGATHVVDAGAADAVSEIRQISDGGVDYAFEVIGLPRTQLQAIEAARVGGTAVLLGMGAPGAKIEIETSRRLLAEHKTVMAVSMGSSNPKHDIPLYADMYLAGRYNLDDLVTDEISLDDIDAAYAALSSGEIVRSVVTEF